MIGCAVTLGQDLKGRRVVIAGACHAPGPQIAKRLAEVGARIVALDADGAGLQRLIHGCGARVEPLTLTGDVPAALRRIGEAWGRAPLHGVINLLPLQHPRDINGQVRAATALTRAFARALMAGQGGMVTVAAVPADPLNGLALGMGPALGAVGSATAGELARHGVRINSVLVPEAEPLRAMAPALALLCRDARDVTGQTIDLARHLLTS